jgi:branched-chain amino acid transport system substrate-binding protein
MASNKLRIALALTLGLSVGSVARAEDGVSAQKILFGQVAALSGPAKDLGDGMRQGISAAFNDANRHGGVFGRTLELLSLDDGYEPDKTIGATRELVEQDKVFAIVGAVGTPTSRAGQPIATAAKVPFIGPFTGAQFLRDPYNRYVVNVRASYDEETEAWIDHLTKDLGLTKIAILYQDDAFGLAGLEGVQRALAARGLSLVSSGSFKRNTTAVKSALLDIMKGQPEAVVTVGPYQPVAAFIKLAHQVHLNARFVAISFVGSDSLAKELGGDGAGVIVSQVVPSPWDKSLPVVAAYQSALTAEDASLQPGFVSLEGYLVGRVLVEALKRVDGEPTQEKLLDAVAAEPFDFGGVKLTYGPAKNQGSNQVFFTILQADGTFKAVDRLVGMAGQ